MISVLEKTLKESHLKSICPTDKMPVFGQLERGAGWRRAETQLRSVQIRQLSASQRSENLAALHLNRASTLLSDFGVIFLFIFFFKS